MGACRFIQYNSKQRDSYNFSMLTMIIAHPMNRMAMNTLSDYKKEKCVTNLWKTFMSGLKRQDISLMATQAPQSTKSSSNVALLIQSLVTPRLLHHGTTREQRYGAGWSEARAKCLAHITWALILLLLENYCEPTDIYRMRHVVHMPHSIYVSAICLNNHQQKLFKEQQVAQSIDHSIAISNCCGDQKMHTWTSLYDALSMQTASKHALFKLSSHSIYICTW